MFFSYATSYCDSAVHTFDCNPSLVYARRMSDAEDKSWHRYRGVMSASTELMQRDENEQALRLIDDAVATAIAENENRWVLTLSHHAAVIARFLEDWPRVKHYYQQSLAFNPDNPAALFGLANAAKEQGEPEVAKEYAARCYKALIEGDDFLRDARLETLLKQWPEVAQNYGRNGSPEDE